MAESSSDSTLSIRGLILVPAVITLGITLLRLGGELAHWPPRFFSTAAGGGLAVVGISWLPILFGPYFAVKLAQSGRVAGSIWKTFALSLAGLAVMIVGGFVAFAPHLHFPAKELVGMLLIALGPTLVAFGWPALFKALVAYGYAARIPVAILMFFALRGHWGTHYDALPPNYPGPTSLLAKYVVVAALPQLIVWIAFTVLVGALVGTLVAGLMFHDKPVPAPS